MCDHLTFDATVQIHRLADTQDGDNLACMLDLRAACATCGRPLVFALPLGVNLLQGATMDVTGQEARLCARIGVPTRPTGPTGFFVHPPAAQQD